MKAIKDYSEITLIGLFNQSPDFLEFEFIILSRILVNAD